MGREPVPDYREKVSTLAEFALLALRKNHPQVHCINLENRGQNEQLRFLLTRYRERYEIGDGLGHINNAAWYGVFFAYTTLAAVVGFQEQRNVATDETWLFLCDYTCLDAPEGYRALATLTAFVEAVPFRVQGLVAAGNDTMLRVIGHRGRAKNRRAWCVKATLVESGPL